MCVCMRVYVRVCILMCLCVCVCAHEYMYVCIHMCVCASGCTCVYNILVCACTDVIMLSDACDSPSCSAMLVSLISCSIMYVY